MTELAALQRAFAAALTARRVEDADVGAFAGDTTRVRERLRLYRGNVQANAAKALRAAYPVVAALVGDAFFEGLAQSYAAAEPSRSGDLNAYGARFAAFLASFDPAAGLPYLPDVATLEWAVHRAHYAADVPRFDPATLATVPPGRVAELVLVPAPAVTVLASRWPLARLWAIHQPDHDGAFEIDLDAGPSQLLVFRPQWRVRVEPLSDAAHALLDAAARGRTLAAALDAARATDPAYTPDADLARWIADGVVAKIALPA